MTDYLEFTAEDWHTHPRDAKDGRLQLAAPYFARQFGRILAMPNLIPPVTTVEMALAWRKEILRYAGGRNLDPQIALYLTGDTSLDEIRRAKDSGITPAMKYYPANATTNSQNGLDDLRSANKVLEVMQEVGLVLCLHGEVTTKDNAEVDMFDREKIFIDDVLIPLWRDFPELRIVFEHITTLEAAQVVPELGLGATVTPHHLTINRNSIFRGGVRPHNYCLPIAKREKHRLALRRAATSGAWNFFLGTDSAPHAKHTKENACGCAGCFLPYALELYAEVFDEEGKLDMLPNFAGRFGSQFYGLEPTKKLIRLERQTWEMPPELSYNSNSLIGPETTVVPFWAGEELHWKMAD